MLSRHFHSIVNAIGLFEPSPILAVGVSGGPDSLALCLLADEWAQARHGKVIALTVDHQLRPESAEEARWVKAWCSRHGIAHHTLVWQHDASPRSVMAEARDARYQLLAEWCRAHGVLHLLTAHHRDDQAETYLLHRARKSGVDGLSAMPVERFIHGVRLLRPLLATPKSTLIEMLRARGEPWLDDPTNHNLAYRRNQLRQDRSSQDGDDLAAASFIAGQERRGIEERLASEMVRCVHLYPEGYATLSLEQFRILDPELRWRMLAALVTTISGAKQKPRFEKLERLHHALLKQGSGKRALGGCVFECKKNQMLVYREWKAVALPLSRHTRVGGDRFAWDRFICEMAPRLRADDELVVRALGPLGKKRLLPLKSSLPTAILHTLPSLWHLEELLAVPHMHYHHPSFPAGGFRVRFRPPKPLAQPAFLGLNHLHAV